MYREMIYFLEVMPYVCELKYESFMSLLAFSRISCKCCRKQNRIIFDGSLTITFLKIYGVCVLELLTKMLISYT